MWNRTHLGRLGLHLEVHHDPYLHLDFLARSAHGVILVVLLLCRDDRVVGTDVPDETKTKKGERSQNR